MRALFATATNHPFYAWLLKNDPKGEMSTLAYLSAMPLAFVSTWISGLL